MATDDEQAVKLLDTRDAYDVNDDDATSDEEIKSWLSDEENTLSRRPKSKWPKISTLLAVALLAGAVLGTVGYFVGLAVAARTGSSETQNRPYRIMVVGDSISEGWEGSYTWRYRLWEWFRDNHVDVVFLGPYNGTAPAAADDSDDVWVPMKGPVARADSDHAPPDKVNGGYSHDVDPAFFENGSAHYAFWGRAVFQVEEWITEQIHAYRPDYVLVELGFNDLGWWPWAVDKTINGMEHLITNARSVDPKLRFAIANVPQRTEIEEGLPEKTRKYNDMLRTAIPRWSTADSPVELVEFREVYTCSIEGCPSGYDGLHPNYRGEFELAYAFSKTLHEKYSLGQQPLVLPASWPEHVCTPPGNPQAQLASNGTKYTWDMVYGAFGYEAQLREVGTEWATDSLNYTQSLHYDAAWATDSASALWELRVRTYCEMTVKSPWVSAVPSNT